MVFVGVQPYLTQLPPTYLSSTRAVLSPALAKTIERGVPPWPAPMTIASYDRSAAIVPSVGSFTPNSYHSRSCTQAGSGTAPSPGGGRARGGEPRQRRREFTVAFESRSVETLSRGGRSRSQRGHDFIRGQQRVRQKFEIDQGGAVSVTPLRMPWSSGGIPRDGDLEALLQEVAHVRFHADV